MEKQFVKKTAKTKAILCRETRGTKQYPAGCNEQKDEISPRLCKRFIKKEW